MTFLQLDSYFPGMAMTNLASTYTKLGMNQDGLVLHERVLELYQRAFPADHPDIGATR
jgi:hypothetical protein